jgi:hypothetical protein
MKVKKYKLVRAKIPGEFEKAVNEAVAAGGKLVGGMAIEEGWYTILVETTVTLPDPEEEDADSA